MIFSVKKGSRQASIIGGTLLVIAILGLASLVGFAWYSAQPKLPLYPHAKEVAINDADVVVGKDDGKLFRAEPFALAGGFGLSA